MKLRPTRASRRAHAASGAPLAPRLDRRRRQDDDEPTVSAVIVSHAPDAAHREGLAALGDAIVQHMFDSALGETLQMAYTLLQEEQARQQRQAARTAAAQALREHLAQLEDGNGTP